MNLFNRPPGIAAVALVVIVGLAIGGGLAVSTRNRVQPARTVVRSDAAPALTVAPTPAATVAPTVAATVAPTVVPRVAPTVVPTVAPTVVPTAAPTVVPTVAPTVTAASTVTADAAVQGAWQIDEANVQVGTIVWSGSAVLSRANTIALDVHKVSVGGRSATRCERETELRASFSVGVSAQTVPYQEVNCQGVSSTGEVRVSAFSSDGRSFHGSFWQDGAKLGDFDARRR